jgi:hypothetical protein
VGILFFFLRCILERSTIVRRGLGFAYGVGQAWLPGGFLVPSAQPQDFAFEFWRGAGQFTAGVIEVVAGAALVGGGGAAAGGGIAASVATGGASLLITAGGGSAVTAGWAAVGHGATGIVAGIATIADSLSLSTGAGSGSGSSIPRIPPAAKGPLVGGGASLGNISPADAARIQNTANRLKTSISLVGSRAAGKASVASDWDYVIQAPSKIRHSAASMLPGGKNSLERLPANQDIFRGPLDTARPFITFIPE